MNRDYCERFGLRCGQFFDPHAYKNLYWFLNDVYIGYGDLSESNILDIALILEDDDVFVGTWDGTYDPWMNSILWENVASSEDAAIVIRHESCQTVNRPQYEF